MNENSMHNEEINLIELWKIIVKYRYLILIITVVVTIIGGVITTKVEKPVYSGNVVIEIGEVIFNGDVQNDKPIILQPLDDVADLIKIITYKVDKNLIIESPKRSQKLVEITYVDTNKSLVQDKLQESVNFILKRHKDKADFFQNNNANIYPSIIISDIAISTVDSKKSSPKIILAIAVISGLIMGIFFAFLLEFFQKLRTSRE